MRHQPHLISERRQPRIDRNPIRVGFRQIMGEADVKRRPALRDQRHSERTRLAREPGTVVICPERRRRQVRMQLSRNLPLRERVLVDSAWGRDHDSSAGQWQRLDILRQHAARRSARKRLPHRPGRARAAPAPALYFRKFRLVIMVSVWGGWYRRSNANL